MKAIAILFLHSYRNADHERRTKRIVEETYPELFVTASHELSQEYREYERTSTTAANAYIGPRVRRYLTEMDAHLKDTGFSGSFLVVQSSGGLFDIEEAQTSCIRMLESGPAAGVIGTKTLCANIGLKNAIAFDMGGTTAKAGVIYGGEVLMTGGATGRRLRDRPAVADSDDRHPGGRHRWRQHRPHRSGRGAACRPRKRRCAAWTGLLRAGRNRADRHRLQPRSRTAGAGPFSGWRNEARSRQRARASIEQKIAARLGLDPIEAADGILRIAATKMSHMVRWVTTERGLDAADFALVAYGGAGPLHAAMIARELRIGKVIIPHAPGHFSAYGMLFADLRRDFVNTWFKRLAEALVRRHGGALSPPWKSRAWTTSRAAVP